MIWLEQLSLAVLLVVLAGIRPVRMVPHPFQDAFCMHAPYKDDVRYDLLAFAVVNQRLYLFAPGALFEVSLREDPPFQVSRGLTFYDLGEELPNGLYDMDKRNAGVLSNTFCVAAMPLGSRYELFLVGSEPFTYTIIRNPADRHDRNWSLEASAHFSDQFDQNMGSTRRRVISGREQFFLVTEFNDMLSNPQIEIKYFDQATGEWGRCIVELQSNSTAAYWNISVGGQMDRGLRASGQYEDLQPLLRNGYISYNYSFMYLSEPWPGQLKRYRMEQVVKHSQYLVHASSNVTVFKSSMIECQMQDRDNFFLPFVWHVPLLTSLVGILLSVLVVLKQSWQPRGHKYILAKNLTLIELTPELMFAKFKSD